MNAMGLIDEILHFVAGLYRRQVEPAAFARAFQFAEERVGRRCRCGGRRTVPVESFRP